MNLDRARRRERAVQLLLGLAHLQVQQHARHCRAQIEQHALEQSERLGLELVQRIALGVAAQMDHAAQMVEQAQMLAPAHVDDRKQHLLFHRAQALGAQERRLLRIGLIDLARQPLDDFLLGDALLGGPAVDRGVEAENLLPLDHQLGRVPLLGIGLLRHMPPDQLLHHVVAHVLHDRGDVGDAHEFDALLEDSLALVIDHVVVFQQILAYFEVALLDAPLAGFERLVHPWMDDRLAFPDAEAAHDRVEPVCGEDAQQIVFEADVEFRLAGIALAAGAAPQLVVDAPAFVALGAQNVEPASVQGLALLLLHIGANLAAQQRDLLGLFVTLEHRLQTHVEIAAELNIGAAAGHVGGDGHSAGHARLRHDLGFLLMVTRVQHLVGNAALLQQLREIFRLLDRHSADQHRLLAAMGFLDIGQDGVVFLFRGPIDLVVVVLAHDRAVGGNIDYVQLVDVAELGGLGRRGAGHAGEFVVEPEIILERDRSQRLVLRLHLDAFLGLDGLVQAFRQPPAVHHAAGEFVDQDNFVVLDDVVLVAMEQLVRAQRLVGVVNDGDVRRLVHGALQQPAFHQDFLDRLGTGLGVSDGALLLVMLVMLGAEQRDQRIDRLVEIAAVLGGAGNDQRRARFVDQDRIDLVDDGEAVTALDHLAQRILHIVAEIIEAEFVVGAISDVGGVSLAALVVVEAMHDDADRQAQKAVDLAHPFGVALGQIIVDGDDVNAAAFERVQINRQRRHQRLALAGAHFRDPALVQDHAAQELHVVMTLAKRTLGSLAHRGECFGEHFVDLTPAR